MKILYLLPLLLMVGCGTGQYRPTQPVELAQGCVSPQGMEIEAQVKGSDTRQTHKTQTYCGEDESSKSTKEWNNGGVTSKVRYKFKDGANSMKVDEQVNVFSRKGTGYSVKREEKSKHATFKSFFSIKLPNLKPSKVRKPRVVQRRTNPITGITARFNWKR